MEGDRTLARVLGVAGVVGLFVVLIVSVALIAGGGGNSGSSAEAGATPTPTPTATPEPTRTAKPKPTPVPLTAEQKAERQQDIDLVTSRSFDVIDKQDWNPDDTLRVLIGRASSGGEMAFFFAQGQYLGNDSTDTSAKLRVKKTGDLEVALSYGIYQSGDDPLKPTGDPIVVHFRYEAGRVVPDEAVPAPEQRTPGRFTG